MNDATRWQLAVHFIREQERVLREDKREPNGGDWIALRNFIRDLDET